MELVPNGENLQGNRAGKETVYVLFHFPAFGDMYSSIQARAAKIGPFCWFPPSYTAFQVWNAARCVAGTGTPEMVYQTTISSSFICSVLILACASSVLRQRWSALFGGNLNWKSFAFWMGVATVFIVIRVRLPHSFTTLYVQLVLPILGLPWILLEGYVVLRLALLLHSSLTKPLRTLAGKSQQTVATVVRNNGNGSTQDGAIIRTAKWVAVGYGLVFAASVAFAIWPWWSGQFPGLLCQCVMLATLVLSCVLTYYSARGEVNRGLLVPAAMIFYVTTLVTSVLVTSNGGKSGAIAGYAFANDVRAWIVFTATVLFCVLKYDDFSVVDVKEGLLRFGAKVLAGLRARCLCWLRRHSDNKRDTEEDVISSGGGKRSSDTRIALELEMEERIDSADAALISTAPTDSVEADLERGERNRRVAALAGGLTSPSVSSLGDYLAVHYLRMLFLVNYLPLLLAGWMPEADRAGVAGQQAYVHAVHLLGWLGVCVMYIYAMCCVYSVNHKYAVARRTLFTQEFGHSRSAEVPEGDDAARSPGG